VKAKVCMLTSVHALFDTRIFYKECKSLVKAGYDVTLIAKHDKKEVIDNIKIIPFTRYKNKFLRILFAPIKMFVIAIKQKADIYHFHDPELIITGILLKIIGKKVIYDVHEDVPKQILYKEWLGNKFIIRKLFSIVVHVFEQIAISLYNGIVAATPDIARKFVKIKAIVRNFPILKMIDTAKHTVIKKDKTIVIYAGGLTKVRGIKEIIQAMEFLGNKSELWLLGKWEVEEFKKECEKLEGWPYVKYLGYKKPEDVYQYIKGSDIGLSLLYPLKNYLNSLPTKAFEYMACSLPIIMSNFPYWKEIFKDCALFADPKNPEDIANKINVLLENEELRKRLGKEGRTLIESKYSWEKESKKLLEIYDRLLSYN